MLSNELDSLKDTKAKMETASSDVENNVKSLEKKLKEKEWELKDTIALKDAKYMPLPFYFMINYSFFILPFCQNERIKESELKLQQMQSNIKSLTDEMSRK